MSFSPLPATFLDDLRARARGRGRVVELGCGDGRFTAVLSSAGAAPLRIDRLPPWRGSVADVVADARTLPLADGSCDLVVAANLLRSFWPPPNGAAVPEDWRRCLRPGGALWIFEDEGLARPAAARNYRDLQDFLARIDPWGRRPLLPSARFRARLGAERAGGRWQLGRQRNTTAVGDREAVLRLLRGAGGAAGGEAARLEASILRNGLSYGVFWWARWSVEEAA